MCGFVAVLHPGPADARVAMAQRMLASIRHRGPDDEGMLDSQGVTLGFRRLAILDLSPLGHQPMESPDGRFAIVFNGEIFNYIEIRRRLQALGREFRSNGDTEVLLQAFAQWGPACVEQLNGMWAFVVLDRRDGRVFCSRDRMGIKPLYLCRLDEHLLIASEIKAIRASGLYADRIDERVVADYLVDDRIDESPASFFEGIEQLPPGCNFDWSRATGGTVTRWYDLHSIREREQESPAAAFAELFEDAIRLHMRSDVPVAVHLSGGLDSTSILCASARVRLEAGAQGALKAFSFSDPEFPEHPYIADTIAQTGAELIQLQTSASRVWDDLPRMLAYQDEPVHSLTPVIGWQLMRLTSEHGMRVVLNGQGADETLGGYPAYFRDAWMSLLESGGLGAAWKEVTAHARASGKARGDLFIDLLRHAFQSRLRSHRAYRSAADRRYRRDRLASGWIAPRLVDRLTGYPDPQPQGLRQALIRSVEVAPLPLYLRVEDRNSMSHSIEARVPFLDHRLVEFGFALDSSWKLRGDLNKFILREAMRGRIPESVRSRRDKMGFPTPSIRWFRQELYPHLRTLFGDAGADARAYVDRDGLLAMLESHREGRGLHHPALFRAAQLLLWLQQLRASPLAAASRQDAPGRVRTTEAGSHA